MQDSEHSRIAGRDVVEHYVTQMRKLAEVGAALCCYLPGAGNPEAWPGSRCDCKYMPGHPHIGEPRLTSEQTGCCEVRAAYYALAKLHNEAMKARNRA